LTVVDTINWRASSRGSRLWYYSGVIDVRALNVRWNAEALIRAHVGEILDAHRFSEPLSQGVHRGDHLLRVAVGKLHRGDLAAVRGPVNSQ
jgi:hypothetical protein